MNVQSTMECQQLVHLITISWLVADLDYEDRSGTLAFSGHCSGLEGMSWKGAIFSLCAISGVTLVNFEKPCLERL